MADRHRRASVCDGAIKTVRCLLFLGPIELQELSAGRMFRCRRSMRRKAQREGVRLGRPFYTMLWVDDMMQITCKKAAEQETS